MVNKCTPNATHTALSTLQSHPPANLKSVILITQNVDGLHVKAGSSPVIEMHGSLFRTRCTNRSCPESRRDTENRDSPIVEALRDRGAPDLEDGDHVPLSALPRCSACGSLTRPAVVWFGENLDSKIMAQAQTALAECDLLFVVGTAGAVYPAAGFAGMVLSAGGNVAEFNLERSRLDEQPKGRRGGYVFVEGKCEETVPAILASL